MANEFADNRGIIPYTAFLKSIHLLAGLSHFRTGLEKWSSAESLNFERESEKLNETMRQTSKEKRSLWLKSERTHI